MKEQWIDNWLMRSAGAVLVVVAILKLASALSHIPALSNLDPVLPFMSTKWLLLAAGQIELLFGVLIALEPRTWYARYGLLAVCATFVIYRVAGFFLGVHQFCPCLGRASDWLHLTARQADRLALVLLVIMCSIALMSVLAHRKQIHE